MRLHAIKGHYLAGYLMDVLVYNFHCSLLIQTRCDTTDTVHASSNLYFAKRRSATSRATSERRTAEGTVLCGTEGRQGRRDEMGRIDLFLPSSSLSSFKLLYLYLSACLWNE